MRLFKRAWKVQVDTIGLAALDCTFKVKRTLRSTPNSCELEIFNLDEDHRRQITQKKHAYVRVEAGYESGTSVIFSGDVRKVEQHHDNVDWVTKITAGDGELTAQTKRVSKSYGPDASVNTVLQELARACGIGIGNAMEAFADAQLTSVGQSWPSGVVLHGNARRQLEHLVRSVGMEMSCQDGVLQVLRRGAARALELVVLSPTTGLIGVPTVGNKGVVKAQCLMIPDLIPGRKVLFKDTSGANGIYRVEVAEYSGDTRGDDWGITLECKAAR